MLGGLKNIRNDAAHPESPMAIRSRDFLLDGVKLLDALKQGRSAEKLRASVGQLDALDSNLNGELVNDLIILASLSTQIIRKAARRVTSISTLELSRKISQLLTILERNMISKLR
jgi:hypothetical protein